MGFTKPKQLEAIVAVVSGNGTFVSLPTGYGKSVVVSLLAHTHVQWKAMADRRCCCWSVRDSALWYILRMRYRDYDVILRRFRIPSPLKPGGAKH